MDGVPFSSKLLHQAKLSKKFPLTAAFQDRNPVDAVIAIKRYVRENSLCPQDAAFDVHVFHAPAGCTVKFRLSLTEREQLSNQVTLHDVVSTGTQASEDAARKAVAAALAEKSSVQTVYVLVSSHTDSALAELASRNGASLHFVTLPDFPGIAEKSISWEDVIAPVPFRADDGSPHSSRADLDDYIQRSLYLVQLPRLESKDSLRKGTLTLFPGRYTVRIFLTNDFLSAQCLFETKTDCEVALRPTYDASSDSPVHQALRAMTPVGMKNSCLTSEQLQTFAMDGELEAMHLSPPSSPRKGISYSAILSASTSAAAPGAKTQAPEKSISPPPTSSAAPRPGTASAPATTAPAPAPAPTPASTSAPVPATTSGKTAAKGSSGSSAVPVIDHRSKSGKGNDRSEAAH